MSCDVAAAAAAVAVTVAVAVLYIIATCIVTFGIDLA